MFRNDDPTTVASLPTAAPALNPGFFTDGNPASGLPATVVQADWANTVTEELVAVVQAAGLTLAKANNAQVLQALQAMTTGRLLKRTVYNTFGTTSFGALAATKLLVVTVLGAGAAGGAAPAPGSSNVSVGSGGGAGALVTVAMPPTTGAVPVTVGTGGTGNTAGQGGGGGTSSFGSYVSAAGGYGGGTQTAPYSSSSYAPQGVPGTGATSSGTLLFYNAGQPGTNGLIISSGGPMSGFGGSTRYGSSGSNTNSSAGGAASGNGAGGSGASSAQSGAAQPGGRGADGLVIVEEYS